jgi:hypothetical protein
VRRSHEPIAGQCCSHADIEAVDPGLTGPVPKDCQEIVGLLDEVLPKARAFATEHKHTRMFGQRAAQSGERAKRFLLMFPLRITGSCGKEFPSLIA